MADNRITKFIKYLSDGGIITVTVVLGLLFMAFSVVTVGCDSFPADVKGKVDENIAPIVEFANVPADGDTFSYAPAINWKGRDADGFIESFSYADITDSTAILDPDYYIDFIPAEAWVTTEAASDTVYLLTEPGKVTQHIFYLKCVDDKGLESAVIYNRFYRTNQQPEVPEIKWWTDADTRYGHEIPAQDADSTNSALSDTLYCLDQAGGTWPGLGFNWKSADPDDRDLYEIPLEYRYYLERVPHDTVWQWVATEWTSKQEIQFYGLETGHYVFTVWARDDGYEISSRPATATFDVYEPTFHQSILLLNTSKENPGDRAYWWDLNPGTPIGDLYQSLTSQYPDVEYNLYSPEEGALPKAYLGRFRLVIWFSENESSTLTEDIKPSFEQRIADYVNVGGRLWVLGLITQTNQISNRTLDLTESIFPLEPFRRIITSDAEFTGAISGVTDLPDLNIDTAKTAAMYRAKFTQGDGFRLNLFPLLPGVDVIASGRGVETAYYFNSYTDTASGDIWNELAEVKANVDTIFYPPTPVDCLIELQKNRVLRINRVWNASRTTPGDTVWGEVQTLTNNVKVGANNFAAVARISYPYGEPWGLRDEIVVDYEFQPFSASHLRPCGIRYEQLLFTPTGSIKVAYRVAVFTFPIYYLDNSAGQVNNMFNTMLNWFFLPSAH